MPTQFNPLLSSETVIRLGKAITLAGEDPEAAHVEADLALLELLEKLGYADVVLVYKTSQSNIYWCK